LIPVAQLVAQFVAVRYRHIPAASMFWRTIREARLRQKAPQKPRRKHQSINKQHHRNKTLFEAVTLSSFDLCCN
jgi:hypothetical protein